MKKKSAPGISSPPAVGSQQKMAWNEKKNREESGEIRGNLDFLKFFIVKFTIPTRRRRNFRKWGSGIPENLRFVKGISVILGDPADPGRGIN